MNDLTVWLMANKAIVIGILILIPFVILAIINRNTVNLQRMAFWYRFPLIGKNARLSKRLGMDDQQWFNSETEVCNSFLPFYDWYISDPYHYEQSSRYLNKVGDTGISPMKWYTWLILSIMVLIEAAGFAYVLAGFTIQDGSEAIQIKAAIGIALLISALLMGFTHAMGGEIYRNQQIGKVRLRWQHDPKKPNIIEPDSNIGLRSRTNELDDDASSWRQIANRLAKTNAGFTKSWVMSIITVIFISMVAIGATYVRGQVLEKLAIEEISGHELGTDVSLSDQFPSFDEESSAPTELQAVNKQAEDKAFRDAIDAHKKGGWMTFIMLAVIFSAMQAYSIYLGFKSTFSGKESENAYEATHRFRNVTTYLEAHAAERAYVERVAQSVLSHLQSKLAITAQKMSGEQAVIYAANHPSARSFFNFYKLSELKHNEESLIITSVSPQPIHRSVELPEAILAPLTITTTMIHQVKNNQFDQLTDAEIVETLRVIKQAEQQPVVTETPEQRLSRLQAQASEY